MFREFPPQAIDCKNHLWNFIEEHGGDGRVLDLIEPRYCRMELFELIKHWFASEYSPLKTRAKNISWAENLLKKINEIERLPNISQQNILKKLVLFCRKYHYPKEFVLQLECTRGYCAGFVSLVACAFVLEYEPVRLNEQGKEIPKDDWTWLKKMLRRIAVWDEKSEFSVDDQHHIKRIISLLEFFQKVNFFTPGELGKSYSDTRNRILNKLFTLGSCFTEADLTPILHALLSICHPQQKSPVEIIFNVSHSHASLIIKITQQKNIRVFFYDPNNIFDDVVETNNMNLLSRLIFVANLFCSNIPSPLAMRLFSFNQNLCYPKQENLLKNTEIVLNKTLNDVSRSYCKRLTALHMACVVDCEASVRFLLAEGADASLKDNDDAKPHYYCDSMKVRQMVLDKLREKNFLRSKL